MDGYESNAGSNTTQWVGELSFRNDGKRVADCGFKTPRFRNTGEPGGGFVLPPTPDPEEEEDEHALGEFEANTHSVSRSVADESFADGRESPAPSGEQSVRSVTREPISAVSIPQTQKPKAKEARKTSSPPPVRVARFPNPGTPPVLPLTRRLTVRRPLAGDCCPGHRPIHIPITPPC